MEKNTKLISYYQDLKNKTTKPKFKKYYSDMILHLKGEIKKAPRERQYRSPVYVKSLNKTFSSSMKASIALGKSRNYVYFVLKGKYANKYGIKQLN